MQFHFPFTPRWPLLGLIPILFCLSCSGGGKYNSVQGKVLYNNEPIQGVVVTFHPKQKATSAEMPRGVTDEDGTFIMKTGKDEGTPIGEYLVTFYCLQPAEGKADKKGKSKGATTKGMTMQKGEMEDLFKGAYSNEGKSTFKVEIKSGKNELEPFNLK